MQVKGWVAFATSAVGHRPAKPGEITVINVQMLFVYQENGFSRWISHLIPDAAI